MKDHILISPWEGDFYDIIFSVVHDDILLTPRKQLRKREYEKKTTSERDSMANPSNWELVTVKDVQANIS